LRNDCVIDFSGGYEVAWKYANTSGNPKFRIDEHGPVWVHPSGGQLTSRAEVPHTTLVS